MKKFQFNLDTVLRYKQQVMDEIQNEYSAALLRVQKQEERLHEAEREYAELNMEFRRAESEGITIAEALRYENGLRFLEMKIHKEEQLLEECRKKAEEKRQQLVAARQDTSSLEKLKEKKLETYQKEMQKSEELFIEEMVSVTKLMTDAS